MDVGYIGSAREQGQIERAHRASGPSEPLRKTVGSAIDRGDAVGEELEVRFRETRVLAERAINLATLIGGPYALPASDSVKSAIANAGAAAGTVPAVESLHHCIDRLRSKAEALHDPYLELCHALDAIERAIG